MEYQQFVNFLRKRKLYKPYLKNFFSVEQNEYGEYPRNSFCKKQNLKELYEDNLFVRDIFILTVVSLFDISVHYGNEIRDRITDLHLKWYDYYHGE